MKISFIITLLISLTVMGCTNSEMIELKDNVYLKKVAKEEFELVFDEGTEEEWIYKKVDSLSISENYGFLFYGISKKAIEKKWFYVTGAPLEFKKGFGNWYDAEFRKYRLEELLNGEQLYLNLKSTRRIWKEKN